MNDVVRALVRWILPRPLRNWLRRPGPSLAWLRDSAAHAVGRDRTVEIRPGWALHCHPAAYRAAYRAHVADPEQVAELDAFIGSCRPGMCLFDLGAHFGLFSLAALHFGGNEAVAVAVDPSPVATRMLATQARLNGVADRIRIVRAAAAAQDGELALVDAGVGAAGYFVPSEHQHVPRERTVVSAVTIDTLVGRAGREPTHIKLDVEGGEADALRGATKTLAGAAPVLFVELHNAIVARSGRDPSECLALLRSCGYATLRLDGTPVTPEWILAQPLTRIMARKT